MTNILKSLIYLSVCITFGVSCKSEVKEISESERQNSYGDWSLEEAQKDGKITRTLQGAKFSIDSLKFVTNLFGENQSFVYDRTGAGFKLKGDQSQLFSVEKSTADTLILGMKRRDKQFELLLLRDTTTVGK